MVLLCTSTHSKPTHALNAPPGQALRPKGLTSGKKGAKGFTTPSGATAGSDAANGRVDAAARASAIADRRAWLGGWHHWQFAMPTHHFRSRWTTGIGESSSDGQQGAGRDWKARALLARPEAADSGEVISGEMSFAVDPISLHQARQVRYPPPVIGGGGTNTEGAVALRPTNAVGGGCDCPGTGHALSACLVLVLTSVNHTT